MGNISNLLHQALVTWLCKRGLDAVGIANLEQDTQGQGYCETCYYEEAIIRVTYITSFDEGREYVYIGDMGELIRELDAVS